MVNLLGRFKITKIGLSFSLALLFVFSLTTAGAFAASCSGTGCGDTNPYSTGCANDSFIKYSAAVYYSGNHVGTNYFHYSLSCHTAWSKVVLYSSAPSNYYADTTISSNTLGGTNSWADCSSELGGNDWVMKGQTSCYSGQIYDGPGNTAYSDVYINGYSSGKTGSY